MLTNKHFIIALIVTPILAIMAYFATDYVVSEHPQQASTGSSYPLAAKSNCRYASGRCSFANGDIKIELSSHNSDANALQLQLHSAHPLQGANIALASTTKEQAPQQMALDNNDQTLWQITLQDHDIENARLLLVISVNDVLYYGETETTFINNPSGFAPTLLR